VAGLGGADDGHEAPNKNMTTCLIEKGPGVGPNPAVPGLTVPGKIAKMGYKGVDTTELIRQDVRVPDSRIHGGRTGQGFYQMMDGVEVGRVNVAARACGISIRAFELAVAYAQQLWGDSFQVLVANIPAGTTCQMWVVHPDGTRTVVAAWTTASDEGKVWYAGSMPSSAGSIGTFQITAGSQVLLTVRPT